MGGHFFMVGSVARANPSSCDEGFGLFVFTGESSDSEGETTKLWNQIN